VTERQKDKKRLLEMPSGLSPASKNLRDVLFLKNSQAKWRPLKQTKAKNGYFSGCDYRHEKMTNVNIKKKF